MLCIPIKLTDLGESEYVRVDGTEDT